MLYQVKTTLPLLSLPLLALAGPLEQRAPQVPSGPLENQLMGTLPDLLQGIKDILDGTKSAIDNTISGKPIQCSLGPLAAMDKCCVWYDVSKELTKNFVQSDGQCNDNARGAVRMGFHDAGAWDKSSPNGGADGSLLMDFGEIDRPENNGLQNIRTLLRGVQAKFGVGYADLAQYAHNHATISCPKGPRVRTFVGRKDATKAAPKGLLPDVHDSADNLIALFQAKGFDPHDLAALVGAHSTARQRFVDTSPDAVNKPLDTTIGVWDVEFYNDTLNNPEGSRAGQQVFVMPSDKKLSVHPKINDEWKQFVGQQQHWNEDYAKAYLRMSLNGVANLRELTDCTRTLPASRQR